MNRLPTIIITVLAANSLLVPLGAQAETVNRNADLPNSKKTVVYMYSRPMIDALYQLGVEQDKKLDIQQECKSEYKIKPYSVAVLSPIDFPEDKQHPIKGVWNFRYQLDRCGELKFYNALFIANNGEPPIIKAYFPGSTYAGPLLVKDAMQAAMMGALIRSGLKDCKELVVFDMHVTEKPHDVAEGEKAFKGVWNETWTFKMCGKMVDVPMTFTPNEVTGGTSFSTGPAKMGEANLKP